MRRASIDIGSNSVLLLVADFNHNQIKELLRESRVTGLGKDLDKNNRFLETAMMSTFSALNEYVEFAKSFQIAPHDILVTATEASRVAENAESFYQNINQKLGLTIHIINSKAEAELTTLGILQGTASTENELCVLDIGGASTELIRVNLRSGEIQTSISMPVGSVRASDWLEEKLFEKKLNKIFSDFSNELNSYMGLPLLSVAGTLTSLGNMHLQRKEFIEDDVHGLILTKENIDQLYKNYSQSPVETFQNEFPFLGKRAMSIRGGLSLVYHLFHRLNIKQTQVSTYGLRYGSLYQGYLKPEQVVKRIG